MYWVAIADPIVRTANVSAAGWLENEPPLRILLVSDVHVAGPDMPPSRLSKIVAQMNALKPDLIAFAGDFVSDKRTATAIYSVRDAIAPLKALKAKQGIYAVLGNHDHWRSSAATRSALEDVGIAVLNNSARQVGPLVLGGIDDDFTDRSDVPKVLDHMSKYSGYPVYLSHSPDVVPLLPARESLILAGHTHCGQIALPLIGAIATMSEFGDRYACGKITEGRKTIIVGAGLGTSILPLRLGVPPDMWLITIGPGTAY